jgi:hypothetical protein
MANESTRVTFNRFTPEQEAVSVPIFASEPTEAARLIESLGDEAFMLRRTERRFGGKRATVASGKSMVEKDNVGGVGLAASKPVTAKEIAARIRKSANVTVTPRKPRSPRKPKTPAQTPAPAVNS